MSVSKHTSKSGLRETLKMHCKGKTDALSTEVNARIEYASCIRSEEAKYHRDCVQRFLSGRQVRDRNEEDISIRRNICESKNDIFQQFCEWYENNDHVTSSMTLYDVQQHMKDLSETNESVYTIKWISKKLEAKYGHDIQVTSSSGRPSIIMLRKEADQTVSENIRYMV